MKNLPGYFMDWNEFGPANQLTCQKYAVQTKCIILGKMLRKIFLPDSTDKFENICKIGPLKAGYIKEHINSS